MPDDGFGMRQQGSDGEEELSQDRQENTPENRREGQTLPLRHVPQEKSEAGESPSPLVLPDLFETKSPVW